MSDYPIQYEKPRTKDFWCEQDAKWHPKCECKEQCWDCALVQGSEKNRNNINNEKMNVFNNGQWVEFTDLNGDSESKITIAGLLDNNSGIQLQIENEYDEAFVDINYEDLEYIRDVITAILIKNKNNYNNSTQQ